MTFPESDFKLLKALRALLLASALPFCLTLPAAADTLDEVRDRERVNCGVDADLLGFSKANNLGEYSGFDVDFCRAVASAVLDDPEAVNFVLVSDVDRFEKLSDGRLDILSRKTVWNLEHSVADGQFAGINYYDGQGFMVSREQGLRSALELDETALCVIRDAKSELNIIDFFTTNRMRYNPIYFEDDANAYAALEAGQCAALTADKSALAAQRAQFREPAAFVVLPEIISKKPLGPMVPNGDARWENIVRWTLNCMINAEELGIDSASVVDDNSELTLAARRLQGLEGDDGSLFGLSNQWCAQVIRHVGNYGESYERNVGSATPLALNRGVNRLWTDGGLLYALPVY